MNISSAINVGAFEIFEKKVLIRLHSRICETPEELLSSDSFKEVLKNAISALEKRNSLLLNVFGKKQVDDTDIQTFIKTLEFLTKMRAPLIPKVLKGSEVFLKDIQLFNDFVEYLYNFWRSYDRFIVCDSTGDDDLDKRPYRTFNSTVGNLTNLVRTIYRDIQSNLTGEHPRIYRQVSAGAEVAAISAPKNITFPSPVFNKLNNIAIIRQILLYPPLILNPPMNKRSGRFERVDRNPLEIVNLENDDWLCYPAKVGELLMLVYFHKKFAELGFALCNLFELADDVTLQRKPDAVYLFGVPDGALASYGESPTIFYDDEANDMMVAACPNDNKFGYFGYLKKMMLTLHNIKMMKMGRLPFHGALLKLILKGNRSATILFIGDTGAGKSETLEALRELGEEEIQDMIIIADDMGSLQIDSKGKIIGYGTEIGAFLRLDDLQPGYALGQIDRAIIMNPNQVNARIILPVTTFDTVIKGHPIDCILYANNYEEIDEEHPLLEQFNSSEQALKVFREGTVMSKGTTTSQGIVHSYFANIFGPPQYKQIHDALAQKYFQAFFDAKVFVGEIRTRLGLSGWERKGPEEAAKELLRRISKL